MVVWREGESMSDTSVSPYSARELGGSLAGQSRLSEFSLPELEEIARSAMETHTDAFFLVVDCCVEVARRAGDRPTDRADALREFAIAVGFSRDTAWSMLRVGMAFPPEEREKYPQFTQTHFQVLAERSRLPDDTPAARQARIRELAERAADDGLTARATRRMVEEELRPGQPAPAAALRQALSACVCDGCRDRLTDDAWSALLAPYRVERRP